MDRNACHTGSNSSYQEDFLGDVIDHILGTSPKSAMAVENDDLVVCERCGHRWDGFAQCDCHYSEEDEEVVEVE